MILSAAHDPMGRAIKDYFETGRAQQLIVHSTMFDDDEMPVEHLFRTERQMNAMEQRALQLAKGRILDVGSGSGCHSLALQVHGKQVVSIDVSPNSIDVQQRRGVKDARLADFFIDDYGTGYDTVLLLMNGAGICGRIANLPKLFAQLDKILAPGGCVLTDSSDLSYIYEDDEGFIDLTGVEGYYGEVDFQMQYGDVLGNRFDWVYIDFDTLFLHASACGYNAEQVCEGENGAYLARITRKAAE